MLNDMENYETRLQTEEQTKELCIDALNFDPELLKFIIVHTEEIVMHAIEKKNCCFILSKIQTPVICKYVLSKCGVLIRFVNEQTDELAEIAVKNSGSSLMFVNNKTYDICKLAVTDYGCALKHVPIKLQDIELCDIALKQNMNAFMYIREDLKQNFLKYDIGNYKNCSLETLKLFLDTVIYAEKNITCPLCDECISQERFFLNFGCKKDHVCCIKCFSEWFPKKIKQCLYCTNNFSIKNLSIIEIL